MRLAYLSTDPGIAYGGHKGASVHLGEVTAALGAGGHEVLVLVAEIAPVGDPPPPGVTVEELPGHRKGLTVHRRLSLEHDLAASLDAHLRAFRPVALYERLALHSSAGSVVAGRLGIPHLIELNAPLRDEAARYRGLERPHDAARLERAALTRAALVFAVSPPLAEYAASNGASRVEVLQNAAAVRSVSLPRNPSRHPVAVFSGSLRPWHGIDAIAEAWRRMGASAPPLLVIGDGPARTHVEGLGATVIGPVPPREVPALLARAEIGLAPYSADSPRYFSPLKLFEYLAAGLATVVADLPAVTAVVDSDTAVVIPAGDARRLADAVTALCADASERERLGANARALIGSQHTWGHRARRIVDAVGELTRSTPVPA